MIQKNKSITRCMIVSCAAMSLCAKMGASASGDIHFYLNNSQKLHSYDFNIECHGFNGSSEKNIYTSGLTAPNTPGTYKAVLFYDCEQPAGTCNTDQRPWTCSISDRYDNTGKTKKEITITPPGNCSFSVYFKIPDESVHITSSGNNYVDVINIDDMECWK